MAAYSYGSSYESLMKKNCGYRQLGNYYTGLYDNITSETSVIDNKIVAIPSFGQAGYNRSKENFSQGTNGGSGDQCNTWRMGQPCDGRALNKDAYTQCVSGVCPSYTDTRGLSGNSLYARY